MAKPEVEQPTALTQGLAWGREMCRGHRPRVDLELLPGSQGLSLRSHQTAQDRIAGGRLQLSSGGEGMARARPMAGSKQLSAPTITNLL